MRQRLLGMVLLFSSVIAFAENDHQRGAPSRDAGPHQQAERASFTSRQEERENTANRNDAERRSSGRLSPDERRELRRQINEVGHDIYQPRR